MYVLYRKVRFQHDLQILFVEIFQWFFFYEIDTSDQHQFNLMFFYYQFSSEIGFGCALVCVLKKLFIERVYYKQRLFNK